MDILPHTPHDDFFKVAFSRHDVVSDYLKEFLDERLVKNIDFQTLTISNTSYITEELETYFADVVWECRYGKGKNPIKAAFIFEHKSYVPKYPHLQLLRYMLEVWQECEKNKQPLTPIIPIIVYHNKRAKTWKYKPFSAYFKGLDPALLPYIPTFEYQLTDLTTMSDDAILAMERGLLLNTLLTLQFGANKIFLAQKVEKLLINVKNIAQDEHLHHFFRAQLVYLLKNNELSTLNLNHIVHNFKNTVDMNAYDQLKNEFMQQGIGIGREEAVSEKDYQFTKSLILSTDFEDTKIATLVGVTIEYVSNLRATLKN